MTVRRTRLWSCCTRNFGRNEAVQIIHQVNRGKAAALNNALSHAQTDIVVTIDADTEIESDAIRKLLRHFSDPTVGAVAGNVKVGNRSRWLTRWQALEYVTSQNMEKRAFDLLNCITVVPGALGRMAQEGDRGCRRNHGGYGRGRRGPDDCDSPPGLARHVRRRGDCLDRSSGNAGGADSAAIPVDVWDVAVVLEAQRHAVPAEVWNAGLYRAAEHFCVSDRAAADFAAAGPAVFRQLVVVGAGATAHYADPADCGPRRTCSGPWCSFWAF